MKPTNIYYAYLVASIITTHAFAATDTDYKTVASKAYVDHEISTLASHTVNGAPLSNTSTVFAGKSTTDAATTTKEVTISGINELVDGLMVIITPTKTSTAGASTLKVNSLDAKPMYYQNNALTTTTDGSVWIANTPSTWIYDGTAQIWRFAGYGKYDTTTTYYSMHTLDMSQISNPTTAQIAGAALVGTATNNDTISPRVLKNAIQNTNLTANTPITGENLEVFNPTDALITATDTVIGAFGHAQGQIDTLVQTKQKKKECYKHETGHEGDDDFCLLWLLPD